MFIEPDPYWGKGPYVSSEDILHAHFQVIEFFNSNDFSEIEGKGIGGIGPRDWNLFMSAYHRQFTSFGTTPKWSNLYEVSATLFYGIIKDHVFYDANKRTALLVLLYQLYKSSICLEIGEREIEDFAVDVANSALTKTKYSKYNKAIFSMDPDGEVKTIAKYLRNNSRIIDRKEYFITFMELKRILVSFGFDLDFPAGNFIFVVKRRESENFMSKWIPIPPKRVKKIPFPGWKDQVKRGLVDDVRQACGLVEKNGIDSDVFYKASDPILSLITQYQKPLIRLANR